MSCQMPLHAVALLAVCRTATHTVLFFFEPLPFPQPRVGLSGSLAVHLAPDEVLVCQTRVQGRLGTVARPKKLGQRVAVMAGRESKDGILALSQKNAMNDASAQKSGQDRMRRVIDATRAPRHLHSMKRAMHGQTLVQQHSRTASQQAHIHRYPHMQGNRTMQQKAPSKGDANVRNY